MDLGHQSISQALYAVQKWQSWQDHKILVSTNKAKINGQNIPISTHVFSK